MTVRKTPTTQQLRLARANWRRCLREVVVSLIARRTREAEELRLQLTRMQRDAAEDKPPDQV